MKRSLVALALAVVAALSGACTRVGPGYVGIKVSMAGDDRGVNSAVSTTGWTFYNPLLSTVLEYPTFNQSAVWTANLNEGNATNEEITFTNADQMLVAVDVNISYTLDPTRVPDFYVKFRNDDLNSFTHGYLRNAARDAFNTHAGRYKIEQIMGDNAQFVAEVRHSLEAEVAPLGVQIGQFGIIGAPRPPQAVIEAINAKVHAVQLAQQKQNELVQVEADLAKERAKAETYSGNTLIYANAEAEANAKIARSLTAELVEWKKLDKWDGKLPQVQGSGAGGILLNLAGR